MSTYPFSGFLIWIVFLFGGTGLLTIGICGIVRQHLRNHQNLLTLFFAVLVPSLISVPIIYSWLSSLKVGF